MNLSGNTFVALAADGRLFGLDPQLLFDAAVTAVNVFVLFLLLTFILFNPVRNMLKKRQDKITSDRENAENDKNWTIAGTGASITEDSGNAADGKRALKFWASDAYSFSATQTITGLETGEYVLTAMSQGAAADNAAITDGVALSATTGGKTTTAALELRHRACHRGC